MITKPNLSKLLKPFENKWVALSSDYRKVLSSGDNLKSVVQGLSENDKKVAIFHKVIPSGFAPHAI